MSEPSRSGAVAVGIDGGGTSTRVLLVDGEGRRLGEGQSGSGNLHDVGESQLQVHVDEAWRGAWAAAGTEPRVAESVFCAMASVGTPGNRETVRDLVARVGVGAPGAVEVDIDLVGALAGGLGGGDGIVLIAGTGSSCFGRDRSGRTFQSGGWGSLLDDVGSATWLGTGAMIATSTPPPATVPAFAWATDAGTRVYRFEKFLDVARTVMARRDLEPDGAMEARLRGLHPEAGREAGS